MNNSETLFEALKELVGVSNPGLVTKEDLRRLESRLDELGSLFDEIEARIREPQGEMGSAEQAAAQPVDDFDDSL